MPKEDRTAKSIELYRFGDSLHESEDGAKEKKLPWRSGLFGPGNLIITNQTT